MLSRVSVLGTLFSVVACANPAEPSTAATIRTMTTTRLAALMSSAELAPSPAVTAFLSALRQTSPHQLFAIMARAASDQPAQIGPLAILSASSSLRRLAESLPTNATGPWQESGVGFSWPSLEQLDAGLQSLSAQHAALALVAPTLAPLAAVRPPVKPLYHRDCEYDHDDSTEASGLMLPAIAAHIQAERDGEESVLSADLSADAAQFFASKFFSTYKYDCFDNVRLPQLSSAVAQPTIKTVPSQTAYSD